MGPLFESSGVYYLTVILDGETSSNVSVTIVDGEGESKATITTDLCITASSP